MGHQQAAAPKHGRTAPQQQGAALLLAIQNGGQQVVLRALHLERIQKITDLHLLLLAALLHHLGHRIKGGAVEFWLPLGPLLRQHPPRKAAPGRKLPRGSGMSRPGMVFSAQRFSQAMAATVEPKDNTM